MTAAKGMRKRATVDEFKFATQWDAVGEPARFHVRRLGQLRKHVRGGLAFHGRIGGDDHFLDFAFAEPGSEQVEAELPGAEAIHRRKAAKEDEIMAAIAGCGLDGELVDRCLDYAQQMLVARGVRAQRADFLLAETTTAPAIADLLDRQGEPLGQAPGAGSITLKHMERHALRGFRAHSGQAAECLDQIAQQGDPVLKTAS